MLHIGLRPALRQRRSILISAAMLIGTVGASGDLVSATQLAESTEPSDPTDETQAVVVLRVGTDDAPGVPAADQIERFAEEVDTRSAGTIRIEPVWSAVPADQPGFDQLVAGRVLDGELEMAMVPARAWDMLGVDSFRPLHAPFLLTSDPAAGAIATDPLADEMLAGLEEIGVTGLVMIPEGLRHLFSFGEPMLRASDYRGRLVRAPASASTFAVLEALGATPDDLVGPGEPFDAAVADGSVAAAESSFRLANDLPGDATVAAGNVTPYPKFNVLVIAGDVLERLPADQQVILTAAAVAARDTSIAAQPTDAELARRFCELGGTVVLASEGDLATLVTATEPVVAELERDEESASALARIREIVAAAPPGDPVVACAPAAGGSTPVPEYEPVTGGVDTTLVVNTQIGLSPSPVLEATGPLAACTEVHDLDLEITAVSDSVDLFSGQKRLVCDGGEVTIRFDATMDFVAAPGVTGGTWSIVDSSLPGVTEGNGQLAGSPEGCEVLAGADGCVLDTFTGSVSG